MDWKYLLTSFQGRINRKPWWLAAIAVGIVGSVLIWILIALFGTVGVSEDPSVPAMPGFSPIGWVLAIIVYIALIWASLALSIKRLHDRNRSGWFILLGLVPLVNIWVLIEIYFLKGTTGPNRFGDDPLAGQ